MCEDVLRALFMFSEHWSMARDVCVEVTEFDEQGRSVKYTPVDGGAQGTIKFDYCVIASGCNFGLFHKLGESLWFPTVWEKARGRGRAAARAAVVG